MNRGNKARQTIVAFTALPIWWLLQALLASDGPRLHPHPQALPNSHAPGEVDRPEMVPFIVADPAALPGIVADETSAELQGEWQYSTHTPPYVGLGYLHDRKAGKGEKSVTFTPELPEAGWYQVRLAHCYNVRRSTRVPVTVHHADGETVLRINQQEEPEHGRLFRTLGTFRFEAGRAGWVRVSNEGTEEDKVVIADAVQFLPAEAPKPKRGSSLVPQGGVARAAAGEVAAALPRGIPGDPEGIVGSLGAEAGTAATEAALARQLGQTLKAQGHPDPFRADARKKGDEPFDTRFLNTPHDLDALARRLADRPVARLCLHGPPSTGKTTFGQWLSREQDLPLVSRTASDLLGPFVGQIEQQIADAFEKAPLRLPPSRAGRRAPRGLCCGPRPGRRPPRR